VSVCQGVYLVFTNYSLVIICRQSYFNGGGGGTYVMLRAFESFLCNDMIFSGLSAPIVIVKGQTINSGFLYTLCLFRLLTVVHLQVVKLCTEPYKPTDLEI
jgi:hypothetical protein